MHKKINFRNEELFYSVGDFLIRASETIHSMEEKRATDDEEGWKQKFRIITYRQKIQSLPEYEKCYQIMKGDKIISRHLDKPVGIPTRTSARGTWDYLGRILGRVMNNDKKKFNDIFSRMYHDLEKFFYSDHIPMIVLVPLQNFEADFSSLELGKGLAIRKIEKEHKYLLEDLENLRLSYYDIVQMKYIIEYRFKEKKIFGDLPVLQHDKIEEKIRYLVTAMRLFKTGDAGFSFMTERSLLDIPNLAGDVRRQPLVSFPQGKPYFLTRNNSGRFKKFWQNVEGIDFFIFSSLRLALNRFDLAYERASVEDKIVDQVISFESLLGKKGEPTDSLTYKISLRFCRLYEKQKSNRKEYFDKMKVIYSLRSAIVHGDRKYMKKHMKAVGSQDVEEYLRKTIKAYIQRSKNQNHELILNNIDFS